MPTFEVAQPAARRSHTPKLRLRPLPPAPSSTSETTPSPLVFSSPISFSNMSATSSPIDRVLKPQRSNLSISHIQQQAGISADRSLTPPIHNHSPPAPRSATGAYFAQGPTPPPSGKGAPPPSRGLPRVPSSRRAPSEAGSDASTGFLRRGTGNHASNASIGRDAGSSTTGSPSQSTITLVSTPAPHTGSPHVPAKIPKGEREARDKDGRENREQREREKERIRHTPHLPHAKDAPSAPAAAMYWSRAPVWGTLPTHAMRAHSVTLVDNIAWLFGGCDEKGCWKDVWCFNTETMQWTHPECQGTLPPPCRAHTATLVDNRRLVIFGGGEGPVYYNAVYVLDLPARRWTAPQPVPGANIPPPRRAHTAVHYKNRIWVFGGGNGMTALNDVWALDINAQGEAVWEELKTSRRRPSPRGYHTANLIGNVMVVVGGSDGRDCFSDVWALDLDTATWTQIKPDAQHRRLSHASTQVGSYLFITGGHDGTEYLSDLLLFNLVSLQFESRPIAGRPPAARGYHASILADSRLFIFGGFSGHDVFDDVHVLDLAAAAYLPQVTSFRVEV